MLKNEWICSSTGTTRLHGVDRDKFRFIFQPRGRLMHSLDTAAAKGPITPPEMKDA